MMPLRKILFTFSSIFKKNCGSMTVALLHLLDNILLNALC